MKVFVTNIPAFYKINLYNELNRIQKIHVIFTDSNEDDRNTDFVKGELNFECSFLSGSTIEKIKQAISIVRALDYSELVMGGWDHPVLWSLAFKFPKSKNSMFVESSYYESKIDGIKGLVKRLFIRRISKIYASGKSQKKITDGLGFAGETIITKGVGVFNYIPQPKYKCKQEVKNFVYVGRLVEVKNLELLISVFEEFPQYTLNIIGFGELESHLKSLASSNVIFHGAVENIKLSDFYQQNDVFILPSIVEPWGLVVEEALNNGLPVIVSDRVGCAEEIINETNGIIFRYNDRNDLKRAIERMTDVEFYNELRLHISHLDFEEIEKRQVEAYL